MFVYKIIAKILRSPPLNISECIFVSLKSLFSNHNILLFEISDRSLNMKRGEELQNRRLEPVYKKKGRSMPQFL